MYENWKILKSELQKKQDEYSQVAEWCNTTGEYHLEEQGKYYAVVKNPEPTQAQKEQNVRSVRNEYLQQYDFTQLPDAPFTTEEKAQYAGYREYLRGYTDTADWWKQNPQTFDEWKKTLDNILD